MTWRERLITLGLIATWIWIVWPQLVDFADWCRSLFGGA